MSFASGQAATAADVELLTPSVLSLTGDARLVGASGERSWIDEGFGKLRSSGGAGGEFRIKPELGSANIVWQPRAGFAWSATVVASIQGGERSEAGLSEAFASFKPMRRDGLSFSARAGLMWPPISTEHGGADWHVTDTVTPSAINSWVAEELRPLAAEATIAADLNGHNLSATAAIMSANDTAGTLLAFRGWALHDRRTLAVNRQPLPPLPEELEYYQPQYTHPLLDVSPGFARRPGYYARVAWQTPDNVRLELFRYDNRARPEWVNEELEWGWRTRFQQVAAVARPLGELEIKGQAMVGRTQMGIEEQGRLWVDARFKAAFLLATHPLGKGKLAARIEKFHVRQNGSLLTQDAGEPGRAALLAYSHPLAAGLTGIAEALHVSSRRGQREEIGLAARQTQTQLQVSIRFFW
ncbi:hypothetical protein [Sphingomonas piscis]|nr:hypothetical protein [Sphingomonas piscis]